MALHDVRNERELARILEEARILVLDFWAPWCPPCKAFAPLFEEAAGRHPDVAFCRINTQDEEGLSAAFEVSQIPALVVIRDRVMVASQEGYLKAEQLDNLLRQVRALEMEALLAESDQQGAE